MKSKKLKQILDKTWSFNITKIDKPNTTIQESQQEVLEQLKRRNHSDELQIQKLQQIANQLEAENEQLQQDAKKQFEKAKQQAISRINILQELQQTMEIIMHNDFQSQIQLSQLQNSDLTEEESSEMYVDRQKSQVQSKKNLEKRQKVSSRTIGSQMKQASKKQEFKRTQINPNDIKTEIYAENRSIVCQICYQTFKYGQQIQRMPCCAYINHKSCLKAYWDILPSCPICESRHLYS